MYTYIVLFTFIFYNKFIFRKNLQDQIYPNFFKIGGGQTQLQILISLSISFQFPPQNNISLSNHFTFPFFLRFYPANVYLNPLFMAVHQRHVPVLTLFARVSFELGLSWILHWRPNWKKPRRTKPEWEKEKENLTQTLPGKRPGKLLSGASDCSILLVTQGVHFPPPPPGRADSPGCLSVCVSDAFSQWPATCLKLI